MKGQRKTGCIWNLCCCLIFLSLIIGAESGILDPPVPKNDALSGAKCISCEQKYSADVCESTCTCLRDFDRQLEYGILYVHRVTLDGDVTVEVKHDDKVVDSHNIQSGDYLFSVSDEVDPHNVCFFGNSSRQERPPRLSAGSVHPTCFTDVVTFLAPDDWDRTQESEAYSYTAVLRLLQVSPGVFIQWPNEDDTLPVKYLVMYQSVPMFPCLETLEIYIDEYNLTYTRDERPMRKFCGILSDCKHPKCLQPEPVYPVLVDDFQDVTLDNSEYVAPEGTEITTSRQFDRVEINLPDLVRPEDVCLVARMAKIDDNPYLWPHVREVCCSTMQFDLVPQSSDADAILDRLLQKRNEIGSLECIVHS